MKGLQKLISMQTFVAQSLHRNIYEIIVNLE